MGHDIFESNLALQSSRENSSRFASVTQDGAEIWAQEFFEKDVESAKHLRFRFFLQSGRPVVMGVVTTIIDALRRFGSPTQKTAIQRQDE